MLAIIELNAPETNENEVTPTMVRMIQKTRSYDVLGKISP